MQDDEVGIGGTYRDKDHPQERHHTMVDSTSGLPHHEMQDQTKWTYSPPDVELQMLKGRRSNGKLAEICEQVHFLTPKTKDMLEK